MPKWQMIVVGFGLLLMLVFIGCGNDDCASCPETVTPLGHAQGALILLPGAYMPGLEVFSNGAVAPDLDSVKVGDSLVDRLFWGLGSEWSYVDAHWVITYGESGDTSTFMYEPGDVASISVWGQGRSSVCHVKILNPSLAATSIISPAVYADTIVPGGSDTVVWHKIEHVDYYAIMVAWYVIPLNTYTFNYYYATDTSFIITGAMQPEDTVSVFNVHVTPFNGPDPRTGQTNWSGNLLDGVVYSFGTQNSTTIVVRQPPTVLKMVVPEAMKAQPEPSTEDIVANVYEKYRK